MNWIATGTRKVAGKTRETQSIYRIDVLSSSNGEWIMVNPKGKIIIEPELNIWPHELKTAEALAAAGYTVEFIRKSDAEYEKTADVLIDGVQWEMKAPKSGKTNMILKNLRRALHQSCCVVFDARRMKNLPNQIIEREVRARAHDLKSLRHLIYINRYGEVVTIR